MKLNKVSFAISIAVLFHALPAATLSANADNSKTDRIIVSMGDSYSSGEGIDDFYDSDLPLGGKVQSQDWLAHRSKNSWGGQLTLPGVDGKMSDNRDSHWYFVAASGATTEHITGEQYKYYNKGFGIYTNKKELTKEGEIILESAKTQYRHWKLPPQKDIFEQLSIEGKKADYVTITIGGNDVGFSDIITKAASPGCIIGGSSYWNANGFSDLIDMLQKHIQSDDITNKLIDTYKLIHKTSDAKIIVAGYPRLLAPNGGGGLFNRLESEAINDAVKIFNMKIHRAVLQAEIDDGKQGIYHFVSVEEKFNNHEAYSDDPFINPVEMPSKIQDICDGMTSSYSMHPNEEGAEIYRSCVQAKIDELERTTSEERDIVLVLDVSGSMAGNPLEETKKASSKFISTILKEDASIGIVTYDNSASMVSNFSIDEQTLNVIANEITDGGGTNIESGLAKAQEMLSTSNAKKKIIVLMSDGEPNDGKVGDELISYADRIKADGTYIYTLGFFQSMGSGKSSAQMLMEQIASDGCHYEVSDADDLVFFFGDIADQINGQKYIYVRIACPVDVTVQYGGEKLCSLKEKENTRTSFGSLTFEESTETYEDSSDDRVKILRLKDDFKYDIKIEGNGRGSMDYTVGFMDENCEYSDLREFNDIKINKRTQINTVAENASSTVLKVDSDGDGKYDLKYKAKANGVGEIVDYSYILYIALGILILIFILVIYIKIKRWKKQRIANEIKKKSMKKKFCVRCGNEMSGEKAYCENCGNKMD